MTTGGDGEVVNYLLTNVDAVGFVGYPIYAKRVDILRVSFVNRVEPTPENIYNYPLLVIRSTCT